jgi:hypothetical protein
MPHPGSSSSSSIFGGSSSIFGAKSSSMPAQIMALPQMDPAVLAFALGSPMLAQAAGHTPTAAGLAFRCPCGGSAGSSGGSSGGSNGGSNGGSSAAAAAIPTQQQQRQQPALVFCRVCGIIQHEQCFKPTSPATTAAAAAAAAGATHRTAAAAVPPHMCDICRLVAAAGLTGWRLQSPLLLSPRLLTPCSDTLSSLASAAGAGPPAAAAVGAHSTAAGMMGGAPGAGMGEVMGSIPGASLQMFAGCFWLPSDYQPTLQAAAAAAAAGTGVQQQQQQTGLVDILAGCLKLADGSSGATPGHPSAATAGAGGLGVGQSMAQGCCFQWPPGSCSLLVNGRELQLQPAAAAGGSSGGMGGLVSVAGLLRLGSNDIIMTCPGEKMATGGGGRRLGRVRGVWFVAGGGGGHEHGQGGLSWVMYRTPTSVLLVCQGLAAMTLNPDVFW